MEKEKKDKDEKERKDRNIDQHRYDGGTVEYFDTETKSVGFRVTDSGNYDLVLCSVYDIKRYFYSAILSEV